MSVRATSACLERERVRLNLYRKIAVGVGLNDSLIRTVYSSCIVVLTHRHGWVVDG